MLVDTHCHLNIMVKEAFDEPLQPDQLNNAQSIIAQAHHHNVTGIINVGTSLVESKNCIMLAQKFTGVWAAVGIHPNDCTDDWQSDITELKKLVKNKEKNKIVAIGETGLDRHYPDYNIIRQKDAFRAQIDLALTHDLALIVHTRKAKDETLSVLEEFKGDLKRGIIHCFSEDLDFARHAFTLGFVLGIGGTVTYPNNATVRSVVETVPLSNIVLETDAPFLPPQTIRGKQNSPAQIATIAHYIAELKKISYQEVADQTTHTACTLFDITLEK